MPTTKARKRTTNPVESVEKGTEADTGLHTAPTSAASSPVAKKTGVVTRKGDDKSDKEKDTTKPVGGNIQSKAGGSSRYTGRIQWAAALWDNFSSWITISRFWVKRGRGMISSTEVKGDLEVTKDSFKDSGGKEFWFPTADDEVTFDLSLEGGKFVPTNVQVTKYHHFPGGPKALEKLIAAGKIAAPQETTEAVAEIKKTKETAVKKGEKTEASGKSEEKKICVIPLETRKASESLTHPTRKLSKDAPEFIPHSQTSPNGTYTVGDESGLAPAATSTTSTPLGGHLETDYWAEAARKVSSTSLHVAADSDSLPITYAQLLHLQDFYEAIKHAEALSQKKGAPKEAMPPAMSLTTPGKGVMV